MTRGLMSIMAALRGETGLWPKDKMLDFSILCRLVWLLFVIRYFLANKNDFQPFFHSLVLFCL